MVREQAIDPEGVDNDQDQGKDARDGKSEGDRNTLVHGVRVLEGDVAEGEVLVEWLDGVEDVEANDASTVPG